MVPYTRLLVEIRYSGQRTSLWESRLNGRGFCFYLPRQVPGGWAQAPGPVAQRKRLKLPSVPPRARPSLLSGGTKESRTGISAHGGGRGEEGYALAWKDFECLPRPRPFRLNLLNLVIYIRTKTTSLKFGLSRTISK